MSLPKLYHDSVLAHNRKPVGFGPLADYTHHAHGRNALCGDFLEVFLRVDGERIEAAGFDGECCAVAMASASMLMARLPGQSVTDAIADVDRFQSLIGVQPDGRTPAPQGPDAALSMGEIDALQAVSEFPSRYKSATLAWHAVRAALQGETEVSTER